MNCGRRVEVLVHRAHIRDGIARPIGTTVYDVLLPADRPTRRPVSVVPPRNLAPKQSPGSGAAR